VRPVKIDGVAPWCAMTAGEEIWSIAAKIISLGPEVVVNHIEKNHQSLGMRRLYKTLQVFRSAIRTVGRKRKHAVVAPVALPGKIRDRHQFNGRHSQIAQIIELLFYAGE